MGVASQAIVTVDVGNSAAKFHHYSTQSEAPEYILAKSLRRSSEELSENDSLVILLDAFFGRNVPAVGWALAGVHLALLSRIAELIAAVRPSDRVRTLSNDDVPLDVNVEHPQRVGIDRLLAAAAVNQLRDPSRPAIVIDAGSAVTVDLVTSDGVFQGGAILPGISLQAAALANADQLPKIDTEWDSSQADLIGKSTEAAMRTGLLLGLAGAVREVVAGISATLELDPDLFLTGGDVRHLQPLHFQRQRVVNDLVSRGILLAARQSANEEKGLR